MTEITFKGANGFLASLKKTCQYLPFGNSVLGSLREQRAQLQSTNLEEPWEHLLGVTSSWCKSSLCYQTFGAW